MCPWDSWVTYTHGHSWGGGEEICFLENHIPATLAPDWLWARCACSSQVHSRRPSTLHFHPPFPGSPRPRALATPTPQSNPELHSCLQPQESVTPSFK